MAEEEVMVAEEMAEGEEMRWEELAEEVAELAKAKMDDGRFPHSQIYSDSNHTER